MELSVEKIEDIDKFTVGDKVIVSFDEKDDMNGIIIALKHNESIVNFGYTDFGENSKALHIDKFSNDRITLL